MNYSESHVSAHVAMSFASDEISLIAVKRKPWSLRTGYVAQTRKLDYDAISSSTGLVVNQELLARQLRSLCEERTLSNRRVAIAVPSMLCFFTHVDLQGVCPRLNNSEILPRLQPRLPCDIERLIIDYHVYGGKEFGSTRVVACAVKRESIAPYVEVMESVGQTVVSIVPRIFAVARYVEGLTDARRETCFSVVHIEGRNIEILVCDRGVPIAHDRIAADIDELSCSRVGSGNPYGESNEPLLAHLHQALCALQKKTGSDRVLTEVVFAGSGPIIDKWLECLKGSFAVPCTRPHRVIDARMTPLGEADRRDIERGRYDDVLGLLEVSDIRERATPNKRVFRHDNT